MNSFYQPNIKQGATVLSPEESKHCALVLRQKAGDEIEVFDGLGTRVQARLTEIHKNSCAFEILTEEEVSIKPFRVHLAIAATKNTDRMEWMVEKLSEIGVDELSFIKTSHAERDRIRINRLQKKAISAMKQCKYPFLLKINEPVPFDEFIGSSYTGEKWIAQVGDHPYLGHQTTKGMDTTLLVGPEGDFSDQEMLMAASAGFLPISLGKTTLRTETAGLLACHFINQINAF